MRQLLAITGLALLFSACSHENNEPIRKFTSFQVDSMIVFAENPIAIFTPANLADNDPSNDYPVLAISAIGNHDELIQFKLVSETANLRTGLYRSSDQDNRFRLGYDLTSYNLQASPEYGDFYFQLTQVQDTLIEGKFSGILIDSTGTLSQRSLANGYIRAVFIRDTI